METDLLNGLIDTMQEREKNGDEEALIETCKIITEFFWIILMPGIY